MREVNHETITDTLSWFKILPLNGFNPFRQKQKTSQETEKSLRKFLEQSQKQKFLIRTIRWNLEIFLKIYHGIIEPQHLIDPRQMALLKEPYEE